ncbi:MAG: YicC family protein [Gemmatimonadota bacterium]|nr:YicC family protein [Gemmatimonadota bacterium]
MTGFGAAEGQVGKARVAVEVRSVNHRFFSASLKLPGVLSRWEGEVREALRRGVSRGHVTLTARADHSETAGGSTIDEARLAEYVARLRELQRRYELGGEVDLRTVLRLPDVVTVGGDEDQGTADELIAIVDKAVTALGAMREQEGARLAAFLEERLQVIEEAVERLAARAPARTVEQRDRLRQAVRELADGLSVDEGRLAQEIAILADRLDVQEELERFRSHLSAFRGTLRGGTAEGVGKRLGFLLQEMLREANTTGSKANDVELTRGVLIIKEELERAREQVENLE